MADEVKQAASPALAPVGPAAPKPPEPPKPPAAPKPPDPKDEPKPKGKGPQILAAKSLRFRVIFHHWLKYPPGTILSEKQLAGPDNVARLLGARCIEPVAD